MTSLSRNRDSQFGLRNHQASPLCSKLFHRKEPG
jgi:hypothetical protein